MNNDQLKTAQIAKPKKNEPDRSRMAPTRMGARNMVTPENVKNEPQTTATCPGVIPFICIGKVSNVGI